MSGKRVVIIGGGQAAARAAAILLEQDNAINLTVLSDEDWHPYERPPLSKNLLLKGDPSTPVSVNPDGFYLAPSIRLLRGSPGARIDRDKREVIGADGTRFAYDFLLIATGSRPRRLPNQNDALPVHYLRTVDDAVALKERLRNADAVLVLGGGAIGTELAAVAAMSGVRATIVEAAERLMGRNVHPLMSEHILKVHQDQGVDVRCARKVAQFRKDGAVLDDGEFVKADFAVVAIGVVPNTDLAIEAGLRVEDGIVVDERFLSSDAAILAAGDVANYFDPYLGRRHRSEAWDGANAQAAQAAATILGQPTVDLPPPSFWTEQYHDNYQFCGKVSAGDPELSVKDDGKAFNMVFRENGHVVGVCSKNAPRDYRQLSRQLRADFLADRHSAEQGAEKQQIFSVGGST